MSGALFRPANLLSMSIIAASRHQICASTRANQQHHVRRSSSCIRTATVQAWGRYLGVFWCHGTVNVGVSQKSCKPLELLLTTPFQFVCVIHNAVVSGGYSTISLQYRCSLLKLEVRVDLSCTEVTSKAMVALVWVSDADHHCVSAWLREMSTVSGDNINTFHDPQTSKQKLQYTMSQHFGLCMHLKFLNIDWWT